MSGVRLAPKGFFCHFALPMLTPLLFNSGLVAIFTVGHLQFLDIETERRDKIVCAEVRGCLSAKRNADVTDGTICIYLSTL